LKDRWRSLAAAYVKLVITSPVTATGSSFCDLELWPMTQSFEFDLYTVSKWTSLRNTCVRCYFVIVRTHRQICSHSRPGPIAAPGPLKNVLKKFKDSLTKVKYTYTNDVWDHWGCWHSTVCNVIYRCDLDHISCIHHHHHHFNKQQRAKRPLICC